MSALQTILLPWLLAWTLLAFAIAGGSAGALLGMFLFRHKTLHRSFCLGMPAILLAQLLLAGGLYLWRLFA